LQREHNVANYQTCSLLRIVLGIFLIISAGWFFRQTQFVLKTSQFDDFVTLYHAGEAALQGQSPYAKLLQGQPYGGVYKYPPFVAIVIAPLTAVPSVTLAKIYCGVSLLIYLASFLIMVRSLSFQVLSTPFLVLSIAFLYYQPSIDTLYGAQHEFLLLLLLTIAWAAERRSQSLVSQAGSGGAIGLAAIIKVFPAILMIYYVLVKRQLIIWTFLAVLVTLTALPSIFYGWDLQRQFWLEGLPHLAMGTSSIENQSFFGFFSRFSPTHPVATILSRLAGAAVLGTSALMLLRRGTHDFGFAMFIPALLMILPAAWIHYEVLLLLPFAILLGVFWRRASAWQWILLFIAFALIAYGNEDDMVHLGTFLRSYKFYGVFLLWAVAVLSAAKAPSAVANAESTAPYK
jgi:Glycosyltransferase family 87